MSEKYGHFYRQHARQQENQRIKDKATSLIAAAFSGLNVSSEYAVKGLYKNIDKQLLDAFPTPATYRLARETLLEYVRAYNATEPYFRLYEPDVPVLIHIQQPNHSYEWFIAGGELAEKASLMLAYWQKKSQTGFSQRDLLEGFIFSSIYYGGLNDIEALRALFDWCYSPRQLNKIALPKSQPLYFVHLTVESAKYGCRNDYNHIERYYTHVIDDVSLAFLVAMAQKTYKPSDSVTLETLIESISKRLKLTARDYHKPQLTPLIKYANFNWRQTSDIDTALSYVLQSKRKTTSLPPQQLAEYQNESLNKQIQPFNWEEVFSESYAQTQHLAEAAESEHNQRNVMAAIEQSFMTSSEVTIANLKQVLDDFPQENVQRVTQWAIDILSKPTTKFNVAKTYLVFIAQSWIAKTQGQDIRQLTTADYEDIYDQIIFSAPKDGRQVEALNKQNTIEDIRLSDYDRKITEIDLDIETEDEHDVTLDEYDTTQAASETPQDALMNQFLIAERLQTFHRFMSQSKHFYTPPLGHKWEGNAQVVKANMISPNLYQQMQACIEQSTLNQDSKEMCLVILFVAYRTGLRVSELAGLSVSDCIGDEALRLVVRPNVFRSLKSSSARRVIDIHALLKPEELTLFKRYLASKNRLNHRYLFSLGNGNQPLKPLFYNRLMKVIWDRLLPEHNLSFHSFRHNAFSQLALVLRRSALTYVMTDYTPYDVKKIRQGLLGYYKNKGAWEGLSAFAGHLTTDPTFEHYLHTAHLLAGEQLSHAKLTLPFLVVEELTGISKNLIAYYDKAAYDKQTHTVRLSGIRRYMAKHAAINQQLFFTNKRMPPKYRHNDHKQHANAPEHLKSIFLHDKPNDVIAFLQGVQQALANHSSLSASVETALQFKQSNEQIVNDIIASIAYQHDIPLKTAKTLYQRAQDFSADGRLLPGLPKGERNNHILNNALERAYNLSIEKPEALARFVAIYSDRHIASKSCIKFGKKEKFEALLQTFVEVGCQLIAAQHWQISGKNKDTVRTLKRKLNLDAKIKTGENPHLDWYEARVVAKKHKHSDKTKVKTKQYDSSTGVLKFLGWFLTVNVDYEKTSVYL